MPQVIIKKRRIVLASVLKPLDDTRMLEKIGATLQQTDEFQVSIIGYPSVHPPAHAGIDFYPLPPFKRFSLTRLIIPWIVFRKINQVQPELIIINSPELLFIAALNRIFFARKVVYDVLENYYRNIRFTKTYPPFVRWLLAPLVRLTEVTLSPYVNHYFLAEKGYARELSFTEPHTVLENKLPTSLAIANNQRGNSRLIFTGTLSASTGVFEAIHLCKELHAHDPSFSLIIVGYCAQAEVLQKLESEIQGADFIQLIGGDKLVPHARVLDEIRRADFGIIIYPPNPSTINSMPTKLYEYLALQLPILIRHNEESHALVKSSEAGIILPSTPDFQKLASELKSVRINALPPPSVFWETEAEKLITTLKKL